MKTCLFEVETLKNVQILKKLAIRAEHSIQSRRSCSYTSSCKNHLLLPGMTWPTAHSPLTLWNLSPFNIVSIFRYPRTPCNPVYASLLDPSALAFSLSLHRHPYICIPCSFRFIYYNKQISSFTSTRQSWLCSEGEDLGQHEGQVPHRQDRVDRVVQVRILGNIEVWQTSSRKEANRCAFNMPLSPENDCYAPLLPCFHFSCGAYLKIAASGMLLWCVWLGCVYFASV